LCETFDPVSQVGRAPLILLNATSNRKRALEMSLPVISSGTAETGHDKNGGITRSRALTAA
jgi:hypothetical protein